MTPKEKAEELINNLYEIHCKVFKADTSEERATRYKLLHPICIEIAILAVDEIIAISSFTKIVYTESTNNCISEYTENYYWEKVKTEIEKDKE